MKSYSLLLLPLALLVGNPVAEAQGWETAEQAPPPEYEEGTPEAASAPPPMTLEIPDGPRFRFGVAFTAGREIVPDVDFSVTMFGVDTRFGVQVNSLLAIYVEPHLSFGSQGSVFSSTGTFAAIAMAELTFLNALFVGAGLGYGVLNSPHGPAVAFRVGGYPVKSISEVTGRRRGLMLSLETRAYFTGDPYGTGVQFMGAVGYEAF